MMSGRVGGQFTIVQVRPQEVKANQGFSEHGYCKWRKVTILQYWRAGRRNDYKYM